MKSRILCLILALTMILALLSGCGSKTTDTPTTQTPTEDSTQTAEPAAEETDAQPEEPEEAYFPLAETEDLSYYFLWSQALCDIMDDPEELLYFKTLEEKTNVHLSITPVLSTVVADVYPVMVASNDWCDIIDSVASGYTGGLAQALEDEFIIDLKEYLPVMPNYSALLESNEDLNRAVYLDDGSMPSFGMAYNGDYPITYGLVIRTDYLDKLNMDMPRTIDDYHNVLTAFKTELGVKTPLWLSMFGAYQNNAFSSAYDTFAFTTTNLTAPFIVRDGTVEFSPTQEGMKEYLAMMAQWYNEGLISSDFMTVANNFFPDFSTISDLGVFTVPVGILNQLPIYSDDEDFAISASYSPTLNEGDELHIAFGSDDYGITGTCISTACDNPELAARYIDYWYSEEGFYILNYGVENETYVFDENGKPTYITDVVFAEPSYTTDQALSLVSKQSGTFVIDYINRQSIAFSDTQMEAFDIWGENGGDWLYPTNATMNTDESAIYGAKYAEICTYVLQYIPAVICGEKDLDSTWDDYVATCNKLGAEECTAAKQAAYDRYMSR
jgi:putative aldouronate transport system substrate-binding protein